MTCAICAKKFRTKATAKKYCSKCRKKVTQELGLRYRKKHHTRLLEKERKAREENREKLRANHRAWTDRNRDHVRIESRKGKIRRLGRTMSAEDVEYLGLLTEKPRLRCRRGHELKAGNIDRVLERRGNGQWRQRSRCRFCRKLQYQKHIAKHRKRDRVRKTLEYQIDSIKRRAAELESFIQTGRKEELPL